MGVLITLPYRNQKWAQPAATVRQPLGTRWKVSL